MRPKERTITIRKASERYDFVIHLGEGARVDVVTKSGDVLQTIAMEQITVEHDDDGNVLVDSGDLYERQGTINVGDFDFDGREDFAIQANQYGPYGGPTFEVFLHAKDGERFVRSAALSELTQTTLGFFEVDEKRQRLRTFAKSGCCYHVTEELETSSGSPKVVHRITEDATQGGAVEITEESLVRGRWLTSVSRH